MARVDKYGRGSAAANGEGFVDLAPGDTFAALEAQLKRRIADRFDNVELGISAAIGSKRNASELAKHLASGEEEEVHKFAAKNIGVLFARGKFGISHDDKKAVDGQRWITRFIRVFTPFCFAGDGYLATLTLKDVDPDKRIYAVEAVEINQDAKPRSTPRGAISEDLNSAPFQDLTSQLTDIVSCYVGDVNRTHPRFVGRDEAFSVERAAAHLSEMVSSTGRHCALRTMKQAPILSIIVPSYNMEKYLPKCLGSLVVAPALMNRLEVLVVNDGSKDRTSEIAHEFAAKWPQTFKVIDKENGHYGSCINAALPVATGKYVKVLDADDYFDTIAFAQFLEVLESIEGVDVILCDFNVVNERGEITRRTRVRLPSNRTFTMRALVDSGCEIIMHNTTYRADVFKGLGYHQTEGIVYTDTEWMFEPMLNAHTFSYRPIALYQYLVGRQGQSIDMSLQYKLVPAQTKVFERILSIYEKNRTVDAAHHAYMERYLKRILRFVIGPNFESAPIDVFRKVFTPWFDMVRSRHPELMRGHPDISVVLGGHGALAIRCGNRWMRSSSPLRILWVLIYRLRCRVLAWKQTRGL